MGSDTWADFAADYDELPQHTVNLAEFYIGKYEVTIAQYEACVKAGKCETPDYWENGRFLQIRKIIRWSMFRGMIPWHHGVAERGDRQSFSVAHRGRVGESLPGYRSHLSLG